MALFTKAVKGTQDVLPATSYKNRFLENTLLDIASHFGFKEIRTPVFEHTELFSRGVGDTTDVVQKEMYTFLDKGGRSSTDFLMSPCLKKPATSPPATDRRGRSPAATESSITSASRCSALPRPRRTPK